MLVKTFGNQPSFVPINDTIGIKFKLVYSFTTKYMYIWMLGYQWLGVIFN